MKHKNPSQKDNGILLVIARFSKLAVLGICFLLLISASPDNSQVSRAEFVTMIAANQPQNSVLPEGYSDLDQSALYNLANKSLKERGFNILDGKEASEPLTDNEFVRLTYAFTGEPSGKNLYEQKKFLKDSGMVITDDIGLTTGIEGEVLQYHNGKGEAKNAELASPLYMKDRITTQGSSSVSFTFDDESQLVLGEEAVIRISKHIYDPEKDFRQTIVKLTKGSVRFKVTKGKADGSEFKVVTPTAVAGVRGTEFVVTVDDDGKTNFVGLEGEIETRPILPDGSLGQRSFVRAGDMQTVQVNGIATAVTRSPPGLLKKAQEKTKAPKKGFAKKNKGISKGKAKKVTKGKWLAKASGKNKNRFAKNKKTGGNKKSSGKIGRSKSASTKMGRNKKSSGKSSKSILKNQIKQSSQKIVRTAMKTAARKAASKSARKSAKKEAKLAAKATAKDAAKGNGNGNANGGGNGNGNANGGGNGNGNANGGGNGNGNANGNSN